MKFAKIAACRGKEKLGKIWKHVSYDLWENTYESWENTSNHDSWENTYDSWENTYESWENTYVLEISQSDEM